MTDKVFMTVREVAETNLLSEYALRLMVKQKKLPCIYAGNKCLINYPLLVKQLNEESQRAVKNID